MTTTLSQGCGRRRFPTVTAAEKAVSRGAQGIPEECARGGLVHWHLAGPARKPLRPSGENPIPPEVRRLVLKRDGYRCVCCGRSILRQRYSLGHRLRAGQGGKPVPSNLLTFLGWGGEACHGRIDFRRDPQDEKNGYTVRSYRDPALIPVRIFGLRDPVWLTDNSDTYSVTPPPRTEAA